MLRQTVFRVLSLLQAPKVLRALQRDSFTVLCFHRISDDVDPFFPPIRSAAFENLLRQLSADYSFVPIAAANEDRRGRKPRMAISFDDGYRDFHDCALPLLQKLGVPANQNIVTGCIDGTSDLWTNRLNACCHSAQRSGTAVEIPVGHHEFLFTGSTAEYLTLFHALLRATRTERDAAIAAFEARVHATSCPQFMTWEQVRDCHRKGVEIGSHTATHEPLPTLDAAQLEHELHDSRIRIEQQIGAPVRTLSFPNGLYSDTVVKQATACGYTLLLGTDDAVPLQGNHNRAHILRRITMVAEEHDEALLRSANFHGRVNRLWSRSNR